MKASVLKTEKRFDSTNDKANEIQTYGDRNDQPQRLMEIVAASVTGKSCMSTYIKFIKGRGFAQADFYKAVVNTTGEKVDSLLDKVAHDLAYFHGFALHVNYNALFQIVSVSHYPFEWLRLKALDDDGRCTKLRSHEDWGKRNTSVKQFDKKDIIEFDFFDPSPEIIRKQVEEAGGWNGYRGQILYYSEDGDKIYPSPVYEAAVTDMSNEEGLSNITNRNVRHNFLPSGMVIDYDKTNNSEDQENEVREELKEFQGDDKAGKLMYVAITDPEKKPEFVTFEGKNFDKDFSQAETKTPQNIGRAFQQPPILRAEDVGANFGADLMKNAYDYYNSITESERMSIEKQFERVFSFWHDPQINPDRDYSILPKVFRVSQTLAERLGANLDKVLELVFDAGKTRKSKEVVLKLFYGLEDAEVELLLNELQATGGAGE